MPLDGIHLALVTGGARGIGFSICELLLTRGVRVVVTDVDAQALEHAQKTLGKYGDLVVTRVLDVRHLSAWEDTVTEIRAQWGPIDLLVNNAGIMVLGEFLSVDETLDERQMDINIKGVVNGQRTILPEMLRRGRGHIVNIASAAGQVGVPFAAVYSATKFAVVGLTEAMALEYKDSGVSFSVVCPSAVQTDLVAGTEHAKWPPVVTPYQVAEGVVRAVEQKKELVFVPRAARLSMILPALLPRRITRRIAQFLGMDTMFRTVDTAAREAYRDRISDEP